MKEQSLPVAAEPVERSRKDDSFFVPHSPPFRYFAVTTPGLTATRWLSHVLASHPDVYVAHGKFALDSVMAADFHKEKETANLESLARGNQIRDFYEGRPLEEVLTLYRGIKPGARAYGCVHSYTMHALARAAESAATLANIHILNVVRHPVDFIASHEALVRASENHPALYRFYLEEVFPEILRQFPELFLIECPDYRAFVAFAVSCHAVGNLLFDLCYPEVRHLRMETLTTDLEVLGDFCHELTGLTYASESLEAFSRLGAINQHRPAKSRRDSRETYAAWQRWRQDMAHLMIPDPVIDWLEDMGYDLAMFREQSLSPSVGKSDRAPCLADCLRSMDLKHPLLVHLTPSGLTRAQIVETDFQGFRLTRYKGNIYATACSLGVADVSGIDEQSLRDLQEDGLCLIGATVADIWQAIACVLSSSPQLIGQYRGYNVITFRKVWYAAPVGVAMNLERMRCAERRQLLEDHKLFAGDTETAVKRQIDAFLAK
jgi:hypothetical protein